MNENNPYASPGPTEDDLAKTAPPTPQSFGQALLQGLKLGFKWGNRIGFVLSGLELIMLASVAIYYSCVSKPIPETWSLGTPLEIFYSALAVIYTYLLLCILGVVCGLVLSTMVYMIQKTVGLLKRT